MKAFSFTVPSKVIYGKNAIDHLTSLFPMNRKKAFIVTDKIMMKIGNVKKITTILDSELVEYEIYSGVNTEPNSDHVKEALNLMHQANADFIISIGGGSCIDLAKAISVLVNQKGNEKLQPDQDYLDTYMKHIAIPTTAGTGSEVTDVTVITDVVSNEKLMMKNSYYTPTVALVDPQLTYSCPKHIIASTGVDAFCHAIESLMSIKCNEFSEKFAWSSISLILNNLEKAYNESDNSTYMNNMALASLQAGIAFSNSSVCLVHGMSRPLGAVFRIPHGASNAMLLNTVLEFNKEKITSILEKIGRIVIKHNLDNNEKHSIQSFAEIGLNRIRLLLKNLEIPSISEWGVDRKSFENSLDKMSKDALNSGSPQNNPIVPSAEEIKELYVKSF